MDVFYLESAAEKGKVLAVNINGDVTYEYPDDKSTDKLWTMKKEGDSEKFYLVSSEYRMILHYSPNDGEKIYGMLQGSGAGEEPALWEITKDNSIFTIDKNGDKRFLWSILDGVYVTPDEYIAEQYTPIPLNIDYTSEDAPQNRPERVFIFIWIALFILMLFMIFQKY